ncbi:MAG TPA: hypothetical protein VNZ52_13480 [Candidatus Thermoplasmatota archaeon]|nr:hypothetical protein [Candidatus Thermoplasmatota archaeon]
MYRRFVLILAFALLATPLPALADPPGGDGADDYWEAEEIPLGHHVGNFTGNDTADWYRVSVPAGLGLQATLSLKNGPHVHLVILDQFGYYLGDAHVSPQEWEHPNATLNATLAVGGGSVFLVGVEAWEPAEVVYFFSLEAVPIPDLAVTAIEVTNKPVLRTDMMDISPGTRREIAVSLGNLGAGIGVGTLRVYASARTTGDLELIGGAYVSVREGEVETVVFTWNAVGYAGDVTLYAFLEPWWTPDGNPGNNFRYVDHYVIVGGTGYGASVGSLLGSGPANPVCVPSFTGRAYGCAGAVYDGHYAGAGATAAVYPLGYGPSAFLVAGAAYDVQHRGGYMGACAGALGLFECRSLSLP